MSLFRVGTHPGGTSRPVLQSIHRSSARPLSAGLQLSTHVRAGVYGRLWCDGLSRARVCTT
eukprot:8084787-Prorocentrum_lima.AAC.1